MIILQGFCQFILAHWVWDSSAVKAVCPVTRYFSYFVHTGRCYALVSPS